MSFNSHLTKVWGMGSQQLVRECASGNVVAVWPEMHNAIASEILSTILQSDTSLPIDLASVQPCQSDLRRSNAAYTHPPSPDRRAELTWEDKLFWRTETQNEKTIHVVGA